MTQKNLKNHQKKIFAADSFKLNDYKKDCLFRILII